MFKLWHLVFVWSSKADNCVNFCENGKKSFFMKKITQTTEKLDKYCGDSALSILTMKKRFTEFRCSRTSTRDVEVLDAQLSVTLRITWPQTWSCDNFVSDLDVNFVENLQLFTWTMTYIVWMDGYRYVGSLWRQHGRVLGVISERAPQVQVFNAVRGTHPRCSHANRHAHAKVDLKQTHTYPFHA